jgi:predicted dehydrogenase
MALRVSDCDNMIEACKQNNVRLFVIFQNRYNPAIMAAKKALEEKRFGKFVMSTVRVRWCRNQNYYDMDNWHGTWELDGGVMSQQASHYLDMLRYFMGPVESVQCQTTTSLLDIETEDTSAAIIKFKSGVLGIFEATVATRPSDLEGSLSLLAENGHVIIGGRAANKIESWNFIDKRAEDETIKEQVFQEISDVYGFGHTQNIYEIIRAIRNNVMTPRVCTGESGRENIKILTALYESAALNGKHVVPGDLIKFTPLGNPCSEHRDRLN